MTDEEISTQVAGERRRAAGMFEGLTSEQWATQSLCSQWTVRDIAGHLVGALSIDVRRFAVGSMIFGGTDRYNAWRSRRIGRRPPAELVGRLRSQADSPASPGIDPLALLTDLAVHTRDAARPLGLPVTASPATWQVALRFLVAPPDDDGFVPDGWLGGCGWSPPIWTGPGATGRK